MLLKFQASNHLSIRNKAEISFVAEPLKERSEVLIQSPHAKQGVLPVLALYGANASGKSNLLLSLAFFRNGILKSFEQGDTDSGMPQRPFLLDETSRHQASTYVADFVLDEIRYQYGYSINSKMVLEEWLYQFPTAARRVLFHRNAADVPEFYFGRTLKGKNREIQAITRNNVLFLSAAMKAGHPELSLIAAYFRNAVQFRLSPGAESMETLGQSLLENDSLRQEIEKYLGSVDTGITNLSVDKEILSTEESNILNTFLDSFIKKNPEIKINFKTKAPENIFKITLGHQSEDGMIRFLNFGDESLGTRYLMTILVPLLKALREGKILVLDEITTGLHTLLARKLVTLFMDPNINAKGAQLLFSTHDTNLLAPGLLRRDQVWFAEKSAKTGETVIFPLTDIKTKNSDNIERGYLQGRFGGIPFIPDNQPLC